MKGLTSAFESPTFGQNSTIHVDKPVGSMSISPCGRDVVLASYVRYATRVLGSMTDWDL